MTRTRRLAAAGLGLALVIAADAPQPARAQDGEVEGDGGWRLEAEIAGDGSTVTVVGQVTPPADVIPPHPQMKRVTVHFALADGDEDCVAPESVTRTFDGEDDDEIEAGEVPTYPTPWPDAYTVEFSVEVTPSCNGRYTATVTAVADRANYFGGEYEDDDVTTFEDLEVEGSATVASSPSVAAVRSRLRPDRKIAVGWDPPAGYGTIAGCAVTAAAAPPDFLGYAVQRAIGDADFSTVYLADPGEQCWVDHTAVNDATTAGRFRYRVLTRRAGPDGEVVSAAGSAAVATVEVTPPTTAPPTTARQTPRPSPPRPSASVGANGSSTGATLPPTIPDGTFQETLDYDEEEPGELAAEVPDDADTFLDFVPAPGAGILEPFAIAACLAAWAMHLRYLARRSDDGI